MGKDSIFPPLTETKMDERLQENAEEFKTRMAIFLHESELPILHAMKVEHAMVAVEIIDLFKQFKAKTQTLLTEIKTKQK